MILYFDRCVGTRLPKALNLLGLKVRFHQNEGFPQDMPDEEWLTKVGTKGWTVITMDRKFLDIVDERGTLERSKIGCFCIWGAQVPRWRTMRLLAAAYDRMILADRDTPRPFLYEVTQRGRLILKFPPKLAQVVSRQVV
jgi:hypothetical protein